MAMGQGRLGALAMRLAHAGGLTAAARWIGAGQGCLLMFHRVAPSAAWSGLPNREFHIDAAFLGRLLDHVTASGRDVVTLDGVLARLRDGGGRRFVNFSAWFKARSHGEAGLVLVGRMMASSRFQRWCKYGSRYWRSSEATRE